MIVIKCEAALVFLRVAKAVAMTLAIYNEIQKIMILKFTKMHGAGNDFIVNLCKYLVEQRVADFVKLFSLLITNL